MQITNATTINKLRWAARGLALAITLFPLILLGIFTIIGYSNGFDWHYMTGFHFLAIVLVAWRWPLTGGMVMTAIPILLISKDMINYPFLEIPFDLAFPITGILFIAVGLYDLIAKPGRKIKDVLYELKTPTLFLTFIILGFTIGIMRTGSLGRPGGIQFWALGWRVHPFFWPPYYAVDGHINVMSYLNYLFGSPIRQTLFLATLLYWFIMSWLISIALDYLFHRKRQQKQEVHRCNPAGGIGGVPRLPCPIVTTTTPKNPSQTHEIRVHVLFVPRIMSNHEITALSHSNSPKSGDKMLAFFVPNRYSISR